MNVYIVQGGIGKHVMFSSMIEKLAKRDEDKIAIVCAYPELFKYHPKVETSVPFHEAGFYDKYLKDSENNLIYHEPYFSNYVKGKTHLIEEWFKLNGLEYSNDLPDIYVDDYAVEECERFIEHNPEFIITQFSGGQSPIGMDPNRPHINNGQIRDYPRQMAQEVVNKIKEKYPDMTILNYALPNELTYNLDNSIQIEAPFLFYVALSYYCKSFISIDSSLQHFASNNGNQKNGIVIWGATSPVCLGYEKNINITNAKDGIHVMRPLCNPVGDLFNEDGSQWFNEDQKCMEVPVDTVIEKVEESIKHNGEIENKVGNVVKNPDIIEVNEKTKNMLFGIERQMHELQQRYQTVIESYVAANDKEGVYNLSSDGSKLFKG